MKFKKKKKALRGPSETLWELPSFWESFWFVDVLRASQKLSKNLGIFFSYVLPLQVVCFLRPMGQNHLASSWPPQQGFYNTAAFANEQSKFLKWSGDTTMNHQAIYGTLCKYKTNLQQPKGPNNKVDVHWFSVKAFQNIEKRGVTCPKNKENHLMTQESKNTSRKHQLQYYKTQQPPSHPFLGEQRKWVLHAILRKHRASTTSEFNRRLHGGHLKRCLSFQHLPSACRHLQRFVVSVCWGFKCFAKATTFRPVGFLKISDVWELLMKLGKLELRYQKMPELFGPFWFSRLL